MASAGNLYVDIEARTAKLDAGLRQAEQHVRQSQSRMDSDTKRFDIGGKIATRIAGVAAVAIGIDRAFQAVGKGSEDVLLRGKRTTDAIRDGLADIGFNLPIIGGAIKTTNLWINELAGVNEQLRQTDKLLKEQERFTQQRGITEGLRAGVDKEMRALQIRSGIIPGDDKSALRAERQTRIDEVLARFREREAEINKIIDTEQQKAAMNRAIDARSLALKNINTEYDAREVEIDRREDQEMRQRHDAAVDAALRVTDARDRAMEHQLRLENQMHEQDRQRHQELAEIDAEMRIDSWSEMLRALPGPREQAQRMFEDSMQQRFRAAMQPFGFGGAGSFQNAFGLGVGKPTPPEQDPVNEKQGDMIIKSLDKINTTLLNQSSVAVVS